MQTIEFHANCEIFPKRSFCYTQFRNSWVVLPQWLIALVITKVQIDAVVNSNPAANTLIKQSADGSVKVFYLPATKEFSLISKDSRPPYKPYSFVWKGCA